MLKRDDSDSFKAAYDRAMAIAKQNGSMKIAQGVADAAARNAQLTPPSRLRGQPPSRLRDRSAQPGRGTGEHWRPEDDESDMSDDDKRDFLENIILKFLRKVQAERKARLAGEVVAADFYLRQVTVLEVALDLLSEGMGLDGWELIADLRRGGHGILDIAETPMSRILDGKRQELWKAMSEPERPEHPPERYLSPFVPSDVEGRGYRLEPLECFRGRDEKERHSSSSKRLNAWLGAGLTL